MQAAQNCSGVCWSGDADRNSRPGGGKATISRTWTSGQSLALVMEKAANRGAARVAANRSRIDLDAVLAG